MISVLSIMSTLLYRMLVPEEARRVIIQYLLSFINTWISNAVCTLSREYSYSTTATCNHTGTNCIFENQLSDIMNSAVMSDFSVLSDFPVFLLLYCIITLDTFFFKCGENDFECHDTFDSESEMTSN